MSWRILYILTLTVNYSFAQTENNTSNIYPVFNLDELASFEPGKNINDIPKKYGIGSDIKIEKALEVKKYELQHDAYLFPLWVQYFNGKIIDFYTRLPSYFLHDTFHQSLINRYGQQNSYAQKDSTALYTWENEQMKRVYSGGCTITCYPIYYSSMTKVTGKIPSTYRPLLELFYTKNY